MRISGWSSDVCSSDLNIDGKLDLFLNERLNNVIDVVRRPLALGLVIYIALFGYMVMRGIVSEPWGELVYRMVKLCLLYVAATTVAYSEWITNPLFHGMPDAISQALAGKTITSVGSGFADYFGERKSGGEGKRVVVRVDLGGSRNIK